MRIFLLLAIGLVFGGCAVLQRGNAERDEARMEAAGFRVLIADMPAKKAVLAGLPGYTLQEMSKGGVPYYRYADPARGRIYVGGLLEYEEYHRLTVRQRSNQASNLAGQTATNWGALGPMVW